MSERDYIEHEHEEGTFRVVENYCGDPDCDKCKEGSWIWLFNSPRYNPERWVVAGVLDSQFTSPFADAMDDEKKAEQLVDLYAKLASIFGTKWETASSDWHKTTERTSELLLKVSTNRAIMEHFRRLDSKYVKFFTVPETETAKVAMDRVKTLLAFPDLYKPSKKKKKKDK